MGSVFIKDHMLVSNDHESTFLDEGVCCLECVMILSCWHLLGSQALVL